MWQRILMMMAFRAVLCLENCRVKVVNKKFHTLFTVHGRDLQNELIGLKITPASNGARSCFIEEDQFLMSQVNKTQPRNLILNMVCPVLDPPLTVRILPGSITTMHNVIGYLQTDCRLFMDDFERLANLFHFKVTTLVGQSDLVQNASEVECSSLTQIGSLTVLSNGITPINITSLLSCDVHNVVEVIFQNMSLRSIDDFQILMPNLQGLDLTYNDFTRPPYFPWNNHTMNLPHNLSRNGILQSHYTYSGVLDIPANVYRREFILNHNPNLNLTNFQFHGWIDKLSLSHCNLKELSSGVFSNTYRLQYLLLDGNHLHSLASDVFHSLSQLGKLELQGNSFTSFHDDTFLFLRELRSLNLANNSIASLQGGLFRDLGRLVTLYLQDNNIRYITQSAFQGINTHLKELHLQSNPLSQFPEVVFLLRGLRRAYLTKSSITEIDFVKIEADVAWSDLVASLADSLSTGTPNLNDVKGEPRVIFMSGSRVTSFLFSAVKGYESYWRLSLILKHFKIILDNNPITCDCNILNLTRAVEGLRANNSLTGMEYMFDNWICSYPNDLEGRMLFSVAPRETYCEADLVKCPTMCKCYRRSEIGTIIVDCRRMGLLAMPKNLPMGKLEMWLQGNAIEDIDVGIHNTDMVSILLSGNAIQNIRPDTLKQMTSLQTLYLDDNLLTSIPHVITKLNLTSLKVGGNPLMCNCYALWMKNWILFNGKIIQDTANIKCVNSVSDEGIHVSFVPDEDFVCEISLQAFILPIAIPTCVVLLLLTLCLALFIMWQDFKVWIFVHTGLHPFDQKDDRWSCQYDVFVFYTSTLVDWVQGHITEPLEMMHGLKLFDIHRDSRIGVSYQENISHAVQSSKRILFILTKDSEVDAIARMTLDAALTKRRYQKSNFLLPIIHRCSPKKITHKSLQKYIKAKRYVNTQEASFLKRILYYLPQNQKSRSEKRLCAMNPLSVKAVSRLNGQVSCSSSQNGSPVSSHTCSIQLSVSNHTIHSNVFVWYADADFRFTMENVVLPYEKIGYNCILADRNFIPGAAIQENILSAVNNSFRIVIVLSQASSHDEWLLFVFRFAYEHQIKQRTFLVGLLIRDDPEPVVMDDEIVKHLESHVSIKECDRWFHEKLMVFLKPCDTEGMLNESVFQVELDCDGNFNGSNEVFSFGFVSHL
ncbi:protein toll-like [Gigantopelta aegis]|uniref:protein toll-like n=1 Tax=Gigantopelta aegis TaxID=1735272 RepID=UPI001B887981|nr:protein toll-like [Gigantopelta aegis]XP_041350674.1 protein toll-like [Gigantopelta aegis]